MEVIHRRATIEDIDLLTETRIEVLRAVNKLPDDLDMNMYTRPEYRRRGIASKTLDLLVKDIRARGITAISLEASDMGRPVYEKYGFVNMDCEMELPYERI